MACNKKGDFLRHSPYIAILSIFW